MDKQISRKVVLRRKRKKTVIVSLAMAGLLVSIWAFRSYVKPTVSKSGLITAVVETGDMENTLNASGEVLPEFEEILTSPISASIQNVIMDAGKKVTPGQSVLSLDKSAAQTDFERQKFQLESKQSEISKLKLDLGKSFFDVRSNDDIKQLRISNLADAVENAKKLYQAGGGTRESIEQAELNLKVAQLEKKQLENEISNKQKTMQIEIREAELAAEIQKNNLAELQRKLNLANIVATRPGVVTWVNKNIGATVREGEALARIADLGSFKITGSISDNNLDQLHNGMPVIIRINETTKLKGEIVNIQPSVQNNIIKFDVKLDDVHNQLLRPNMKVDVFPITERHEKVLRIANGPAFKGAGAQDVFVLRKGLAEKVRVRTGLTNFDYVEIADGLKAGDVVILSNMNDFKNTSEVIVK
jgi:HlyD family secretion protein